MLHGARRVFRFWADSIGTEIGLEILLRQEAEPDAPRSGVIVDADQDSEPVHFAPCVPILRKIPDKSDGRCVLDPFSVRVRDPVSEHPGLSFLAPYFLE